MGTRRWRRHPEARPETEERGHVLHAPAVAVEHDVRTPYSEKLMFESPDISKLELAEYYLKIADVALPHYRERALSMHRYPEGINGGDFFQKNIADYFPEWIERATLPKEGGEVTHVVANNAATLVYLADQACITPHLALSRTDRPNHPDRMIFDLDPSDDDFGGVQLALLKSAITSRAILRPSMAAGKPQ